MADPRTSGRVNSLLSQSHPLLVLNKAAEALPLCQEAVALAPQSAQAWVYLSWACIDLNRSAEALEACDRALSIDPHNDWAWKNKGIALNRLKRYEEALEAAAHVSASNREFAQRAGWVRAFALSRLKRFDAMYDEAEQLLLLNPANARNWNWLGDALLHLKRYDEAIAACDRALTLPNATLDDHDNKGVVLLRAGRYADAVRAYAPALALKPDSPRYLNNLGCAYTYLQYYERALEIHKRACAARGAGTYAWVSAAEDLIGLGWLYEALDHLKQASEVATREASHDDDALISALRGIIHTRRGQHDEAMAAFTEAQAADSEDNVVCWGFAELLLALGETEKARGMIERSLTLDPFDVRAWSLKARILRAAGDERGADEAEAHGQRMLTEQRTLLAAWEREQAGQAGE